MSRKAPFGIRLPDALERELDALADRKKISRHALGLQAIRELVDREHPSK